MGGPEFKINPQQAVEPTYANVPDTLGSDYLFPSHQQTSKNEYQKYQNVQVDMEKIEETRLQPLAENAGYMFVNLPSKEEDPPICNKFSNAGMANNDGYSLTHFLPSSPGPRDVFSPRPVNNLEFNLVDKSIISRNDEDVKNPSSSRKNVLSHSPSISPPKEVSGISNLNYIPNNAILPQNLKDLNDVLLDISEKSTSPKRQKNDSGVSSIGSNFENKSPTPPICPNGDTNCNSDMLQNRNSFILHHENVNRKGIDV